jgi:hypothetical protein
MADPSGSASSDTGNSLLGSVQDAMKVDPKKRVYGHSLYSPAGSTTQHGWDMASHWANGAGGDALSSGVRSGQNYFDNSLAHGGLTAGQRGDIGTMSGVGDGYGQLGQDYAAGNPYFEADLAHANDAAGAAVNSAIGSSGRFGSGAHVNQLATTIGNLDNSARAQQRDNAFNYRNTALQGQLGAAGQAFGARQQGFNNQVTGANELGSLFQTGLMPAQTVGAVGAARDANQQGILSGKADLYNRLHNADINTLQQLGSIFSGGGGVSGSTDAPWWQQALGGATGLFGSALSGGLFNKTP